LIYWYFFDSELIFLGDISRNYSYRLFSGKVTTCR